MRAHAGLFVIRDAGRAQWKYILVPWAVPCGGYMSTRVQIMLCGGLHAAHGAACNTRSYAIAPSIAAFSGGASCQRDHAGAVDVDADRVCLAVAPPACCLENAPFESKMKDER